MSDVISFWVPGIPAPGGSKKAFPIRKGGVFTGRVAVTDAGGQKTKDWRNAVAWAAKGAYQGAPLLGPLEVRFVFNMPRPKGHFNSKGVLRPTAPTHHVTKPDALKLARSTEDALTGITYADDSQTVRLVSEKCYALGQSGAAVTITSLKA